MRTISVVPLLLLAFVSSNVRGNAGQEWERMASDYRGVYCVDATVVVVVGDGGVVVRSEDGGTTWRRQSTHTSADLWGVHFTNAEIGVAVGNGGTILRTANGGLTWESAVSGITSDLRRVVFPARSVGYAVGLGGTVLKTTDAGITWSRQSVPTTLDLSNVSFQSVERGVAVGDSGLILRTIDGGATWTRVESGTRFWLAAVSFSSAEHGIAAGEDGVTVETVDGGASWRSLNSVGAKAGYILGVHAFDVLNAVGVGITPQSGRVGFTDDGGRSWFFVTAGAPSTNLVLYWDVSFGDDSSGIAVGTEGVIVATSDRGRSWRTISHLHAGGGRMAWADSTTGLLLTGTDYHRTADVGVTWLQSRVYDSTSGQYSANTLSDAQFLDTNNGFLLDNDPLVRYTTDQGRTWRNRSSLFIPNARKGTAFGFGGVRTGYVACSNSYVYRSADSGRSWFGVPVQLPDEADTVEINGVFPAAGIYCFATGSAWRHSDPTASTRGVLYRTSDGGEHWNAIGVGAERGVTYGRMYFFNERNGMVYRSDGYLLRTSDAGATWDSVRVDVPGIVTDLRFFNSKVGYIGGSYPATINRTDDGGTTWHREFPAPAQPLDTTASVLSVTLLPDRMTMMAAGNRFVLRSRLDEPLPAAVERVDRTEGGSERRVAVTIAPMPARDRAVVTVRGLGAHEAAGSCLRLFDAAGHEMDARSEQVAAADADATSFALDCSGLPAGAYYLRVDGAERTAGASIVVRPR